MTLDNTRPDTLLTRPTVHPFVLKDFRWLWIGATLAALAVHGYSVSIVWLVLYLTGSGVQLGLVLTVAAVPRAISMLLSGAVIDRYPPRSILILSALVNGALMTVILGLLGAGLMSLLALVLIAPLTGLMDALSYPTSTALVPRLVRREQLSTANALLHTADTLANIMGSTFSGLLIGGVGQLAGSPVIGLLGGFAVNALLFIAAAVVFLRLSYRTARTYAPSEPTENLARDVVEGVRYAFRRPAMRASLLLIALMNFAAIEPIVVGAALMAERRFDGDATLYGFLSGAFGVGMLVGSLVLNGSGVTKRPGQTLTMASLMLAVGLMGFGVVQTAVGALLILLFIGVAAAVVNIVAVTWMQAKTEMAMQGRVASLLVFAAVALDPFSNALSGVLGELNLTVLFIGAGGLVALGAVGTLFSRALRRETL
jgi:MFS family permease